MTVIPNVMDSPRTFRVVNSLLVFTLSVFCAGVLILRILLIPFHRRLFDVPDGRKIHQGVIPRLGGIAFKPVVFFSVVPVLGLSVLSRYSQLLSSTGSEGCPLALDFCIIMMLYLVGMTDDPIDIHYHAKSAAQIICGLLVVTDGLWISSLHGLLFTRALLKWIEYFITLPVVVFIISAVNLIDGIDGLVSGLCGVAMLFYGLIFFIVGEYIYTLLAFAILGMPVPLFYHNVFGNLAKENKVFMGGAGGLTIDIMTCILSPKLLDRLPVNPSMQQPNAFFLAYSPLIIPYFDAVRVYSRRVRNGKNPFLPDEDHIHHKMLVVGMRQRIVMIIITLVPICFTLYNTLPSRYTDVTLLLILDIFMQALGNLRSARRIHIIHSKPQFHINMNPCKNLTGAILLLFLGAYSTSKEATYFQDLCPGKSELALTALVEIKIQSEDELSTLVDSQDLRLINLSNLPIVSQQISMKGSSGSSRGASGYTVDSKGNIDSPALGEVHITGMTCEEMAAYTREELQSHDLIEDPVVTVEYMNLSVAVVGEVDNPGRFSIDRDNLMILDALSQAGDLTIYGKREKVLMLHQERRKQWVYGVNLCSAEHLCTSPACYLQQNDVVYVELNATKACQPAVNGNNVRSTSSWISLTFLLTPIAVPIAR